MEEKLTIEEVMKNFEDYKTSKEQEVTDLKKALEQEKLKNAQFSILGVTSKVETKVKEPEPVEFDFDF